MPINPELLRHYKAERGFRPSQPAINSLIGARSALAAGREAYGDAWLWQRGKSNVTIQPKERFDSSVYAWIENYEAAGLRRVGFADEIAGRAVNHKGWYLDSEFQDEVYRGIVLQWPGRKGHARYVAGYADPWNKGAAFIELKIFEGDGSEDDEEARRDAALRADRIAEIHAERERDYQDSWRLGNEFVELAREIAETRQTMIQTLKDARPLRRAGAAPASLCDLLNSEVDRTLALIRKARERRETILREYRTDSDGFKEGAGIA